MKIILIIILLLDVNFAYSQRVLFSFSEALQKPDSVIEIGLGYFSKIPPIDTIIIDSRIKIFRNLKIFGITCNYIDSLPSEISESESIEEVKIHNIHFDNCKLNLQDALFKILKIKNLKTLKLWWINNIPEEIKLFTNLEELELLGTKIIPEQIKYLTNLNTLRLLAGSVKSIPEGMSKLKLKDIYISSTISDYIPEFVLTQDSLQNLTYISNNVVYIPKEISRMKETKKLNLSKNLIEYLPPELFLLDKLEELDLSYNPINQIPEEITKLKKLKVLNLTGTNIPNEQIQLLKNELPNIEFKH